tara:strand:+ start:1131 stop:1808 length:678 start_codon:yes stop_codon:yes gene_type:complete
MENRFLRNSDLIPQEKLESVSIIGLGGIGSSLVQLCSLMGFNFIHGYDHDKLSEHNLSTTSYPIKYLGLSKAECALHTANEYGSDGDFKEERFEMGKELEPCVMMGPDNMDTRLDVYRTWLGMKNREWLIDMRMGALSMEVITVTKENDDFIDTWNPPSTDIAEPCTAKHTIFTASLVASLGMGKVFKLVANRPYFSYIWAGLSPLSVDKQTLVIPKINNEGDKI